MKNKKKENKLEQENYGNAILSTNVAYEVLGTIFLGILAAITLFSLSSLRILFFANVFLYVVFPITAIWRCVSIIKAFKITEAFFDRNRGSESYKLKNGFPPLMIPFLVDCEETELNYKAVMAGLLYKDFISINEFGYVLQNELDYSKWLRHEIFVFKKYKNFDIDDVSDFDSILKEDASLVGIIKRRSDRYKANAMMEYMLLGLIAAMINFCLLMGNIEEIYVPHMLVMAGMSYFATFSVLIYLFNMYNNRIDNEELAPIYPMAPGAKKYKDDLEEVYNALLNDDVKTLSKQFENLEDVIPFAYGLGLEDKVRKMVESSDKYKNLLLLED